MDFTTLRQYADVILVIGVEAEPDDRPLQVACSLFVFFAVVGGVLRVSAEVTI